MKALVPLLLLASACMSADRLVPVSSPLDTFVELTELDRKGNTRRLGDATHLPDPARVDLDSMILVKVKPEAVRREKSAEAEISGLNRASNSLTRILQAHEKLLELQTEAVEAFKAARTIPLARLKESPEHLRFAGFKKRFGAADQAFGEALQKEFPEIHPRRKEIENATGDPEKLRALLAEELRSVERLGAELKAKVSYRIRMWAWLDGPSPIHLEHYDTLTEGSIQKRDRWGLSLSESERAQLAEAMEANRRMADALERLRKGEITVREAVRDQLGPRLGQIADQIDALLKSARSWDERFAQLVEDVRKLATTEKAKQILKQLEARAPLIGTLAAIHRNVASLRDDWRRLPLPQLMVRAIALIDDIDRLAALAKAEGSLRRLLEKTLEALATEIAAAWAASPARPIAESFVADAQAALEIFELARELFELGRRSAVEALPPTETLKIPLDQTKDTRIELERTPRQDGDRVTLKWELLEGETVVDDSRASFEVGYFGHHASLEPSVILATPSRLESGDSDDFQFAPMLSWMHRYTPEPDDAGFVRVTLGFLDAAIGPHAAFLNVDPDKAVEIGLGGTLSIWGDVVQIGGGYNLMAESTEEGGVYFFVGSSLIGLLQKLGLDVGK